MQRRWLLFAGILLLVLCGFILVNSANASSAMFSRTYGGAGSDLANCVIETSDGGYALAGYTGSFGAGGADFWLVKTDANGNVEWNQTYGGTQDDQAFAVVETQDGGYSLAGITESFGPAGIVWLVKTDKNGVMLWNRTYDESREIEFGSLIETSDGGFVLAGNPWGMNPKVFDLWLLKTDADGNVIWQKNYGESVMDFAESVVETSDGGYAIGGTTDAGGGGDFWLVKADVDGNVEWTQKYGAVQEHPNSAVKIEQAYSLIETFDKGFALAGRTNSFGAGGDDFWLVKTDASGNVDWNQTYGGVGDEWCYSVIEVSDGGYALAGQTKSFGAGWLDFWFVKTDVNGNMEWNQTYGGAEAEYANSVIETSDGGFALAGVTSSFGAGESDFWLIKTDAEGNYAPEFLPSPSATENPIPTASPSPTIPELTPWMLVTLAVAVCFVIVVLKRQLRVTRN
jgi:hypothetical protein